MLFAGADQGDPGEEHVHEEGGTEEGGEGGRPEGCRERAHCRRCFQRENWHKIEHSLGKKLVCPPLS